MRDVHKEVKAKSMHHMHGHEAKKHRKEGGRAEYGDGAENEEPDAEDVYEGKDSNVAKEAHGEERKRGGKVKKKAGGKVEKKEHEKKHVGKVEGEEKKHRLDRPGRKRGGGIGSNVNPLSTSARTEDRRGPGKGDDDRGITGEA
jgi:hypothetical protein